MPEVCVMNCYLHISGIIRIPALQRCLTTEEYHITTFAADSVFAQADRP
jgi:hypothetical protein